MKALTYIAFVVLQTTLETSHIILEPSHTYFVKTRYIAQSSLIVYLNAITFKTELSTTSGR